MSALVAAVAEELKFASPDINYHEIAPELIVLTAAVVGVLVEAFVPRQFRRPVQLILSFGAVIAALIVLVSLAGVRTIAAEGAIAVDGPGLAFQGLILVLGLLGMCLIAERQIDPAGDAFAARPNALPGSEDEREFTARGWMTTEVWPLFLFCVGGMLLFVVSNDLLMMFVALEVLSLPLYLMCGIARRRRLLSQEAALKYFLLGSFSSAFFLYGTALLYGFAGSVNLADIATALTATPGPNGLVIGGFGMLAIGLLFKVAAVPFHQWTPDVYQGAPTPITAVMASIVKVAAFGALLRVTYVAFGGLRWDWRPVFWIIAILTMIVGSILALTQTDIKRMLAYSSISHAGFLLIAIIATNELGISAILFYLAAYGVATVGAFAVVSLVRDPAGEATHLSSWAGLGKRSPWVASAFALFLLSFAGIPLTAGFIGKFAVFNAGISGGAAPVVVIAVIASMIAAFFYVRVIVLMFFHQPQADGPVVAIPSAFTAVTIGAGVALTVLLGILPQQLLDVADKTGLFLR